MCGVAGYIGERYIEMPQIEDTLRSMRRRGPDANNYARFSSESHQGVLLHTRLSIIDLEDRANQPYSYDGCTLVFNGEIYNYLEIRDELTACGYAFETSSDTEVLLKAYHAYGSQCVKKFEGMWAFALFDQRLNKLLLSRDRFAEKPLFILFDEEGLFFASEISQIKLLSGRSLDINQMHVYRYLVNGHKSLYKTGNQFYLGLEELEPGTNLIIKNGFRKERERYWNPKFSPREWKEEEAIERIRAALTRSVELRMRADVPLAFCLSGGIDSSAMASIAVKELGQQIQTFSIIDRDPRYNELDNIKATVDDLGCDHKLIELSPEFDYLDRLRGLIQYRQTPVATISYLVHSRLIEAMHEHGFKVSISGTGADELFTGYYDHFLLQMPGLNEATRADRKAYWDKYPAKAVRNPFLQDPDRFMRQPSFREHIYLNSTQFNSFLTKTFKEEFTEHYFTDDLLRNRMLNELFYEVVRVILKEDDANSMYYSIENRSPFLDRELFETAYSIPSYLLIQKGYNKYLLRKAMKGILNDQVRLSREKKGFNASINSVVDFSNPQHRAAILDNCNVFDLVDKDKIEELMSWSELSNSYKKFFFNFLNIKIWLDTI